MATTTEYFQDHMPENICFGCGRAHENGLRISSYWQGQYAYCHWKPDKRYCGWKQLLNGGIMATLIDCHCMCTAMASAYRKEGRALDSQPMYRYATGTMQLRYKHPVRIQHEVMLKAEVLEETHKKTVLSCNLYAEDICCIEAQVIAIRVFDSSQPVDPSHPFA